MKYVNKLLSSLLIASLATSNVPVAMAVNNNDALKNVVYAEDAATISAAELITGSDCTYKSGAVDNQETAANKTAIFTA